MKLRFAPSPTGSLHMGSARVAIVNYLASLAFNASLVLRIEDTDKERSTDESIQNILETLSWLGISYTEGPFYQSKRIKQHSKFIKQLLNSGKAYHCFCSQEDLQRMREEQKVMHQPPGYNGKCSSLTKEQVEEKISQGIPYVIRLRMPKESIHFTDLLKGEVVFDGTLLHDIVIARQDGSPTYNFAVVVDDYEMEITHIVRGEDHVSNTPKQVAIYDALDLPVPTFVHIPLIIGQDKAKLSKRHGDVSIEQYKNKGYLPDALVNYFSYLGYSHDSNDEIKTLREIASSFSFDKISRSPSIFDPNKLTWMNQQYIQELSDEKLTQLLKPFTKSIPLPAEKINQIALLSKAQLKTLLDIQECCSVFYQYELDFTQKKVKKLLQKGEVITFLGEYLKQMDKLEDFSVKQLETCFNNLFECTDLKKRDAIQIIRLAVTGKLISPPIFDTLYLVGQNNCILRMKQFLQELLWQEQKQTTQ